MALNWTLKSLRFGRRGGQYAPAPTHELPDLSTFGVSDGKISGPGEEPSFAVRWALRCCLSCLCLGAVAVLVVFALGCFRDPVGEWCGGPTLELPVLELGSGESLGAEIG